MDVRVLQSIDDIAAQQWNALDLRGNPFVRHEFLQALEHTGCVGPNTGWAPQHLLVMNDAGRLAAAMPLYRKTDSWGEFVFDWSWARAYAQAGLRYYPKLVSMAPFTPATGPRVLIDTSSLPDLAAGSRRLAQTLLEYLQSAGVSSAHLLFLDEVDRNLLSALNRNPRHAERDFLWRTDCQFHWRNQGYGNFEQFIATFRADKRKKALRERRRIREAGIEIRTLAGEEMDQPLWDVVFGFSAATFAARGHEHYLNPAFFRYLSQRMPGMCIVKLAHFQGRPIASAIFFRGKRTLYGRYWGAAADFHSLHFETCYYQGIEYCIEQGIEHFEPGTQGEHKVPRGFEPTLTWSAHWIADPRFRRAIASYLDQERPAVEDYMRQVREHLPFRREGG